MILSSLRRSHLTLALSLPALLAPKPTTARNFSNTTKKMAVTKITLSPGNGVDYPKPRDNVTMHYTGHLVKSGTGPNVVRGDVFDSSKKPGRGPFATQIGVGQVIKGWDEGVPQMSLGETATLEITPDFGYGSRGFPGLIPANSTLFFEVELLAINNKKAEK